MGLANLTSTMYKLLYIAVKFPLVIAYQRPCLASAGEGNFKSVVRFTDGVHLSELSYGIWADQINKAIIN